MFRDKNKISLISKSLESQTNFTSKKLILSADPAKGKNNFLTI